MPSQLCVWVSTRLNFRGGDCGTVCVYMCVCLITLAGVPQLFVANAL